MANLQSIRFKNVKLIFRNFAGKADELGYNREGDRNVCVVLPDEEIAMQLKAEGWNIKQTKPREGYEDEFQPEYYVKGLIRYRDKHGNLKDYPPQIFLVTGKKKNLLTEETVAQLDFAEIQDVRVELSPWVYDKKTGKISIYVTKMYVRVIEDDFDSDYDDYDDVSASEPDEF